MCWKLYFSNSLMTQFQILSNLCQLSAVFRLCFERKTSGNVKRKKFICCPSLFSNAIQPLGWQAFHSLKESGASFLLLMFSADSKHFARCLCFQGASRLEEDSTRSREAPYVICGLLSNRIYWDTCCYGDDEVIGCLGTTFMEDELV